MGRLCIANLVKLSQFYKFVATCVTQMSFFNYQHANFVKFVKLYLQFNFIDFFIGRLQAFAPIEQNIWQYVHVSKLYRCVPQFRYSITLQPSYLRNSTITRPSFGQVGATLDRHCGFCVIKYSRVNVQNSEMGKPSYLQNKWNFECNVSKTVCLPSSSVRSIATLSPFSRPFPSSTHLQVLLFLPIPKPNRSIDPF